MLVPKVDLLDPKDASGSFVMTSEEIAWRKSLKLGDQLDARDKQDNWYEGIIVNVGPDGNTFKIHYIGWAERFDENHNRMSENLQPKYTRVENWRDFREKDEIDCKVGGLWFYGNVVKVDKEAQKIKVKLINASKDTADIEYGIQSEEICKLRTHTIAPVSRRALMRQGRVHTHLPIIEVVEEHRNIKNLGNTCFMNSMLQCFSNTERLTLHLLENRHVAFFLCHLLSHFSLYFTYPVSSLGTLLHLYREEKCSSQK